MNLHMIRAVRLVNARQHGMQTADFVAALSDADRKAAFAEWLRRRSGWAWLAAEDSALLSAMIGIKAARDIIFANSAASAAVAAHSGAMSVVAGSADAMVDALSSSVALAAMLAVPAAKAAIMSSTALAAASVPQMTSDVAPSGVASCGPSNMRPAWNAFDKNNATYWDTSLTANVWLQYQFPLDVFVHTVSVLTYSAPYAPQNCRIEYSEDGILFANAQSVVMAPGGSGNSINIAVSGFYKYWRLFMQDSHGGNIGIMELNFTGFVKP